ncbi:MAG: SEC-C metal-binding domain-containing protein [Proteobacteria bacterium]|nr:SEC-C metal-binding domain-containing protein [Pseudomonadota bacterium]
MAKIGRNEPCPCGSGKKYKKCCLDTGYVDANSYSDFPAIKQYPKEKRKAPIKALEHAVSDDVVCGLEQKILKYIDNDCPDYINEAKSHFGTLLFRLNFMGYSTQSVDGLIDKYTSQFIIPWALYNWVPDFFDQIENDDSEENLYDNTIALSFSKKDDTNLSQLESKLLNSLNASYFSFYKVESVDTDGSCVLTNLLLNANYCIEDKNIASKLQANDIIFARIIRHKDQNIVYGLWPMVIPKGYLERINDLEQRCIELNNNKPLNSYLFRARFEFDTLDILSLIIANMIEYEQFVGEKSAILNRTNPEKREI